MSQTTEASHYKVKIFWVGCPSCPSDDECQGHLAQELLDLHTYAYKEARAAYSKLKEVVAVKQAQIVLHDEVVVAQWRRYPDTIEETLWCKGTLTFADSDLLSATARRHVVYTLFVEREISIDLKSFREYYDPKRGMEVLTFLYEKRYQDEVVQSMYEVQLWNLASEAFADGLTHPDWKDQLVVGERIVP